MEVVSTLCFGKQAIPEPGLIRMLMDIMLAEGRTVISSAGDKKRAKKGNKIPVITSSLLQLLLEHKYKTACVAIIITTL